MLTSTNNKAQILNGSNLKTMQDPVLTSLNKRNFGDSINKTKFSEEEKQQSGITPGKRSYVAKSANHYSLSPNKVLSAKTFDK